MKGEMILMRVLIVDDDELSVKGVKNHCEDNNWECIITDFDACYKEIMTFNPDVVVLDWCKTPGDSSGMPVLRSIWVNGYRPIIIFSGNIDTLTIDKEYENTDLVQIIKKGDEQPVIDFLNKYVSCYGALSSFREEMGKSIIEAFAALEPIQKASKEYIGDDVVQYILSKRAVNFFDFQETEKALPPWAIYLYPPVLKKNLSVCDIIRESSLNIDHHVCGGASEYRIILTPSCDLYTTEKRKAKVDSVLCAKCADAKQLVNIIGGISGETKKENDHKKKLKKVLNTGFMDNMVPLPPMEKVVPSMIADMKALENIDIKRIAVSVEEYNSDPDQFSYIRVCSIDSPFKEQIVWAYLNNACRPGVPDRNMDWWIEMLAQK